MISYQTLGRIPPSRITDLRVETHFDGPRPDLITLIWTAPGDNLNEGTVGKESSKCFSTPQIENVDTNRLQVSLLSDTTFMLRSLPNPLRPIAHRAQPRLRNHHLWTREDRSRSGHHGDHEPQPPGRGCPSKNTSQITEFIYNLLSLSPSGVLWSDCHRRRPEPRRDV